MRSMQAFRVQAVLRVGTDSAALPCDTLFSSEREQPVITLLANHCSVFLAFSDALALVGCVLLRGLAFDQREYK